ncbi:hypothetical protein SGPA1_21107 [Streptomyces misionensis JCM 4497]
MHGVRPGLLGAGEPGRPGRAREPRADAQARHHVRRGVRHHLPAAVRGEPPGRGGPARPRRPVPPGLPRMRRCFRGPPRRGIRRGGLPGVRRGVLRLPGDAGLIPAEPDDTLHGVRPRRRPQEPAGENGILTPQDSSAVEVHGRGPP